MPAGEVAERTRESLPRLRPRSASHAAGDLNSYGKSQNDAAEVGAWLVDLDTFARSEAGTTDLILSAHAGWAAERTRGSSALEDWPDVVLTMTRDKADQSKRYLAAEGRDVLVDEDRIDFDPATRMLSLAGAGSRRLATAERRTAGLGAAIIEIVTNKPGLNTTGLEKALRAAGHGFQRGDVGNAARTAVDTGHLLCKTGPRNSVIWSPGVPVLPSSPEPSQWEHGSSPQSSLLGEDYSSDNSDGSPPDPRSDLRVSDHEQMN